MRGLSAVLGLIAVTAMVFMLVGREPQSEAEVIAKCAAYERQLAALERGEADIPAEAREGRKSALEILVADCRRSGYPPAG